MTKEEIIKEIHLNIIKNSFYGNYIPYQPKVDKAITTDNNDIFAVDWACTEKNSTK